PSLLRDWEGAGMALRLAAIALCAVLAFTDFVADDAANGGAADDAYSAAACEGATDYGAGAGADDSAGLRMRHAGAGAQAGGENDDSDGLGGEVHENAHFCGGGLRLAEACFSFIDAAGLGVAGQRVAALFCDVVIRVKLVLRRVLAHFADLFVRFCVHF